MLPEFIATGNGTCWMDRIMQMITKGLFDDTFQVFWHTSKESFKDQIGKEINRARGVSQWPKI